MGLPAFIVYLLFMTQKGTLHTLVGKFENGTKWDMTNRMQKKKTYTGIVKPQHRAKGLKTHLRYCDEPNLATKGYYTRESNTIQRNISSKHANNYKAT